MPKENQNENVQVENSNNLSAEQIAAIAASAAAATLSAKTANANEAAFKINDQIRRKQLAQQEYASKIKREMDQNINCVTIVIPEIFKKYQPKFTVSINGCTVTIPADGKQYKVHNDFAILLNRRMTRLSNNIARMSKPDITEYRQV